MHRFAHLFRQLDQTNKTSVKVQALVAFFEKADDADIVSCIAFAWPKTQAGAARRRLTNLRPGKNARLATWRLIPQW